MYNQSKGTNKSPIEILQKQFFSKKIFDKNKNKIEYTLKYIKCIISSQIWFNVFKDELILMLRTSSVLHYYWKFIL